MAAPQPVVVVDDLHGPPAEHVGRPHQRRVADAVDDGQGLVDGDGGAAGRLGDLQPGAQRVPPLAVLGQVDRRRAGAEHEVLGAAAGQLQRRLATEGHDDPDQASPDWRASASMHVHHVLVGERLEVEAVAGVVVGRHGLRVAVDHHRLEAGVAQGEAGVDAAVVELDALADAVGARAEDHDLGPLAGPDLVLVLVGRVVVRRLGLELGPAGVDRLERGPHAGGQPGGPHVGLGIAATARPAGRRQKPSRLARRQSARVMRREPDVGRAGPAPR